MKNDIKDKDRMYQNVIITLADGSQHVFSGKAICFPGEKKHIRKIEFTIPKKLPEGLGFEEFE